jgi:beta-lactamase class C
MTSASTGKQAINRAKGMDTGMKAETQSVNAERLEMAADIIMEAMDLGEISAASLTVARNGADVFGRGFGTMIPGGSESVEPDSVFLLASISKPISVCALMILVERGMVGLNDPVQVHLPEFQGEHKENVLVRHLLSHTSGMPDMLPENIALREAHSPMTGFVEAALATPLLFPPDTAFRYQSKGILLATEIVTRKTNSAFREYMQSEVFEAYGMGDSSLGLGGREIDDTVWCGTATPDAESHSGWGPNSAYWRDAGQPWGGVHSTGPDLTRLFQGSLRERSGRDRILFGEPTVQAMTEDQNAHLGAPWGLGWGLRDSHVWTFFGDICSRNTFGHTGATGTVAWADPDTGLSCVILTNEMVENGRLLKRVSSVVASAVE